MAPRQKDLKYGRPPMARPSKHSMSRKASRTLINQHHLLEKKLRQAAQKGDVQTEANVAAEISGLGGLARYQRASLQGQSSDRGGDTSKVLLEWLPISALRSTARKARMLEVGALSTRNACTSSGVFDMVHIDLNSQEPGILKQDFMKRHLPRSDDEKFDVISLSLVLNFVPEPTERGEMLRRTISFLHSAQTSTGASVPSLTDSVPSLFVVLPRSCVENSRYFTQGRFAELMESLGYKLLQSKSTQKLAYSLWRRSHDAGRPRSFPKQEVNPGRIRNNFVITLKKFSG